MVSKRSMAIPVLRRIFLAEHANWTTLAHEAEHAQRSNDNRWLWSLRYMGGVFYPLLFLLGLWEPYLLFLLIPLAIPLWLVSERFRRDEEVAGFGISVVARTLEVGGEPSPDLLLQNAQFDVLHSYKWPYLVGGKVEKVQQDIADRAWAIWQEQLEPGEEEPEEEEPEEEEEEAAKEPEK